MQGDLRRAPERHVQTEVALARHFAFSSLFCASVSVITVLALDLTYLVPLLAHAQVYSPLHDFLSYQVDEQGSGPLMTGVFILLAVAAWSYAAAAYLAPSRHVNRVNFVATLLFGGGLFVAACFRAVPQAEREVDHWLKGVAWLHDLGVGVGFVPALVAAFLDQREVVFRRPGFVLTKLSFWLILVGAVGMVFGLEVLHALAGLFQRFLVIGVVLWLATEAHQLFWSSAEAMPDLGLGEPGMPPAGSGEL